MMQIRISDVISPPCPHAQGNSSKSFLCCTNFVECQRASAEAGFRGGGERGALPYSRQAGRSIPFLRVPRFKRISNDGWVEEKDSTLPRTFANCSTN